MNQSYWDIFINWFPMLVLIGVWVFFLRRMGGMGGKGYFTQYQKDQMAEMRRQSDALERIAKEIEKKSP
jgi:ATP-dependent Zn protease